METYTARNRRTDASFEIAAESVEEAATRAVQRDLGSKRVWAERLTGTRGLSGVFVGCRRSQAGGAYEQCGDEWHVG